MVELSDRMTTLRYAQEVVEEAAEAAVVALSHASAFLGDTVRVKGDTQAAAGKLAVALMDMRAARRAVEEG